LRSYRCVSTEVGEVHGPVDAFVTNQKTLQFEHTMLFWSSFLHL
jgi:hypothetical protein